MTRKPSTVARAAEARETARFAPAPQAGKSILDRMWQELDGLMDQILGNEFEDEDDLADARARAGGVAWCISLVHNPYVGDMPAVRMLAKERWRQRQSGIEVDPLVVRP